MIASEKCDKSHNIYGREFGPLVRVISCFTERGAKLVRSRQYWKKSHYYQDLLGYSLAERSVHTLIQHNLEFSSVAIHEIVNEQNFIIDRMYSEIMACLRSMLPLPAPKDYLAHA